MNRLRIFAYGISLGYLLLGNPPWAQQRKALADSTNSLGTLNLVVNGEDFVREGFTSKDGWLIEFDHLYVNLSQVVAYASQPAFEPQTGDTFESISYQHKVEFALPNTTIDLVEELTPLPHIASAQVPPAFYNALAWGLETAPENSPIAGQTIVLQGQASKNQTTIEFDIKLNQPVTYLCGEYIGDTRPGFVTLDSSGSVEATFHFDHLFGSQELSPEDDLNREALGFAPFATLANNNKVSLSEPEFASQLAAPEHQKFQDLLPSLGHVGEGHCIVSN